MKTILVIEDQPDMRENITTILEMENYAVINAAKNKLFMFFSSGLVGSPGLKRVDG